MALRKEKSNTVESLKSINAKPLSNDRWEIDGALRDQSGVFVLKHCVLEKQSEGGLKIIELVMEVSWDQIVKTIKNNFEKCFDGVVCCDVITINEFERYFIFEFDKDAAKHKIENVSELSLDISGLFGFKLGIQAYGNHIELQLTDQFVVGSVPTALPAVAMRVIAESIGYPNTTQANSSPLILDMECPEVLKLCLAPLNPNFNTLEVSFHGGIRDFKYEYGVQDQLESLLCFTANANEKGAWVFDVEGRHTTIDILETRELRKKYQTLENKLFQFDPVYLGSHLKEYLKLDARSQFLLKRAALAYLSGLDHELWVCSDEVLKADKDTSWLLLSADLRKHQASKNDAVSQVALKGLFRLIKEQIKNIDGLKSMEAVIPEAMGDLCRQSDPNKSIMFYELVANNRPNNLRTVTKLCQLCAMTDKKEKEKEWLLKATQLDPKSKYLAKIFLRIAEIEWMQSNKKEAVNNALKSIQADPRNIQNVVAAADILVGCEKNQEALLVLGELLESSVSSKIPAQDKALLHWRIAKIWHLNIKKIDIAQAKYEEALTIEAFHLPSLEALKEIFYAEQKYKELANVLKKLCEFHHRASNPSKLKEAKEELIRLYREHLASFDDVKAMLSNETLDFEREANKIENKDFVNMWNDPAVDWNAYHEGLQNRLKTIESSDEKLKARRILADICRIKLKRNDWAMKHLLAASEYGSLNIDEFNYIIENKKLLKDGKQIYQFLKAQIRGGEEKISSEAQNYLGDYVDVMDAAEQDEYYWALYKADDSHFKKLHQQWKKRLNENNYERISSMFRKFEDARVKYNEKRLLFEAFVDEVDTALVSRLTHELEFTLLFLLSDESELTKESIISYFNFAHKHEIKKALLKTVEIILESGDVPSLNDRELKDLAQENTLLLGRFYENRALKESDSKQQAIEDMQKAAQYYQSNPAHSGRVGRIITKWFKKYEATMQSLIELMTKADTDEKWQDLLDVLDYQLGLQKNNKEFKHWILAKRVDVLTYKLKNQQRLMGVWEDYLSDSKDVKDSIKTQDRESYHAMLVQALSLSIDGNHIDHATRWFRELLTIEELWKNYHSCLPTVAKVLAQKNNTEVRDHFVDFVKQLLNEERYELAAIYSDQGLKNGINHPLLMEASLIGSMQRKDMSQASMLWQMMMDEYAEDDSFGEFLERHFHAMMNAGMRKVWESSVVEYVTKYLASERKDTEFLKRARECVLLFKTKVSNFSPMSSVAFRLWQQEKDDVHLMLVLYHSLKDEGDRSKLSELISVLVQRAENSPMILDPLKVSLQELKREFETLNAPLKKEAPIDEKQQVKEPTSSGVRIIASHPQLDGDWRSFVGRYLETKDSSILLVLTKNLQDLDEGEAFQLEQLMVLMNPPNDKSEENSNKIRVWQDLSQNTFGLKIGSRLSKIQPSSMLSSDLFELITSMTPLFTRLYRTKYNLKYLKNHLGLDNAKEINALRKEILWSDELISKTGLNLFEKRIQKNEYKIFSIEGLKEEVFFDFRERSFYFDKEFYTQKPPSHLRYQILDIMWQYKIRFIVPLGLDAESQIYPALVELGEYFRSNAVEKVKKMLSDIDSDPTVLLSKGDFEALKQKFISVGAIEVKKIIQIQNAMRKQIYLSMLAECLDIVGLIEWSLGKSIDEILVDKKDDLFNEPAVKFLIKAWMNLKI